MLPIGFTGGDQRAETQILLNMQRQVQNYATLIKRAELQLEKELDRI